MWKDFCTIKKQQHSTRIEICGSLLQGLIVQMRCACCLFVLNIFSSIQWVSLHVSDPAGSSAWAALLNNNTVWGESHENNGGEKAAVCWETPWRPSELSCVYIDIVWLNRDTLNIIYTSVCILLQHLSSCEDRRKMKVGFKYHFPPHLLLIDSYVFILYFQ